MVVPSDREKEIFLFAALFFYFEYVVHSVIESIFRDPRTQTETDSRWAIDELNMLPKKGEHVDFFMERIFANEEIIKYLEFLGRNEVMSLLRSLEETFRNQEFCAQVESWSYFNAKNPEDFALDTASAMLTLLPFAQNDGIYTPVRVLWFEGIFNGEERYTILRKAVLEMLSKMKRWNTSLPLLALT